VLAAALPQSAHPWPWLQVAAQRETLEADRDAFLEHVDHVRQELTAVYAQLRDREAAAAEVQRDAEAALTAAHDAEAEAASQRCASA
jgi:hypothetical protein